MSSAVWLIALAVAALTADVCHAHSCPQGADWLEHSGKCHYLSTNVTSNWFQAELTCRELNGGLVTIKDAQHNNFLYGMTLCKGNFWIGLVNTDPTKKTHIVGYSWWNGSPNNYNVFSGTTGGDCVYMLSNGRWQNRYCEHRTPFICEVPAHEGDSSQAIQPTTHNCPSGWHLHNRHCYFVSEEATNYFNAQMSCQAKGGNVASVLSREEQVFLTITIGCSTKAWVGIEKSRPCFTNPSKNFCWVWMDREPLEYTEWAYNQQSDTREKECVYTQGEWRTANCYSEYKYVCKKEAQRM